MSIKKSLLGRLKTECFHNSPGISSKREKLGFLGQRIKDTIQEALFSNYSEEELKVLEHLSCLHYISIRPGKYVRMLYSDSTEEVYEYWSHSYSVRMYHEGQYSSFHDLKEKDLPEDAKTKIIGLNEEYIRLNRELWEAAQSWDRMITTKTSMTFLKTYFPETYETYISFLDSKS